MTGDVLRRLRRERGLSAAELAGLLEVSPGSIHRWERRVRLPGPGHVRALADALTVPVTEVSQFFDGARTPAPPETGLAGRGLRRLRTARRLSAAGLAERLGVPVHTVYNWERGGCRIPAGHLHPLAAALGTRPEQLVPALRHVPAASTPPQPRSRLAVLRLRRRLSQSAAAQRIGVARSTLRSWEAGQQPPLWAVRSLAAAYGLPTSEVARAAGVAFPTALDPARWTSGDLPVALRTLREWSGLTQREVAERCGARLDTVRAWEAGRCQPSARSRPALESLYRLAPGGLLAAYR